MADPKKPTPAELARQARYLGDMPAGQAIPHKPAPPPTMPGRVGFGKLLVPAKPSPLPLAVKSSPEATRVDGMLQPAPESAPMPPPKRSYSPPPGASPAEEAAIEAMAQSRGERVVRAPESRTAPADDELSPEVLASVKLLRKGGLALGKWLAGLVAAAVLGGGGAFVGSQSQVPPGVAECPAQLEQLRAKVTRLEGRADRLETEADEARARWRRTNDNVEDALGDVAKLKKRVPEPVTP
jgi:hypothetical protein